MTPIATIRPFVPPDLAPAEMLGGAGRAKQAGSVVSTPDSGLVAPTRPDFPSVLGELVEGVQAKSAAAGRAIGGVLAGENIPLHQAMIAMEEASVSFQLMVEVRNKLLESYQELMRMQV